MARETTDTSSKYSGQEIPDGTHDFTVVSVQKKWGGTKKDKPFYAWKLRYSNLDGEQVLMPNMMGALLRVLGCTETEPNKFDWDTDAVEGKSFSATVNHQPDKKDPSKIRQQMGDFKATTEEIPF